MERREAIEKSIMKTYRKAIWSPFLSAVREYALIRPGDRVAVCISGGKDSMLMAMCMQALQKYEIYPFEVKFLVMDPGYNPINRKRIEMNAETLGIPIDIFETDIFEVVANEDHSPCYLCAKMRRGYLYRHAQSMGCDKIALGHHFDDVIETVLLSLFYGAQIQSMAPKVKSANVPGMELIRPLYKVREDDILRWRSHNDLAFIQCACRFTENCTMCAGGGGASKREEVKRLIKTLKRDNPNVDRNIFTAVHNVSLDTLIRWKFKGSEHSFLDEYDAGE